MLHSLLHVPLTLLHTGVLAHMYADTHTSTHTHTQSCHLSLSPPLPPMILVKNLFNGVPPC